MTEDDIGFCSYTLATSGFTDDQGAFSIGPVHVTQGIIIGTFVLIAVIAIIWYRIRTRHDKYKGTK